jgi:hypothetical protein
MDAVVEVVVAPFPLVAGDLDGHVGIGGVLHVDHHLRRGIGHPDQDEEGDDGPDDLDRGVLVELRGLMAG